MNDHTRTAFLARVTIRLMIGTALLTMAPLGDVGVGGREPTGGPQASSGQESSALRSKSNDEGDGCSGRKPSVETAGRVKRVTAEAQVRFPPVTCKRSRRIILSFSTMGWTTGSPAPRGFPNTRLFASCVRCLPTSESRRIRRRRVWSCFAESPRHSTRRRWIRR